MTETEIATKTGEAGSSQVTPETWLKVCSPTKNSKEIEDFQGIFKTTHPPKNPPPKVESYEGIFFPDYTRIAEDFLAKQSSAKSR